ncbi:NAD(P)-binding protein [Macroventuria anomochaeta]|uniref:NAD(P)-binding protein n=1 Tax=Macroventuria anomochaeta TaxID=301207 RepID=A0ACB6SDB0_9PLEO|nr:NAD(P)-binding protein [Macroventuria anomochaeta]KAF2631304.1 NAD(P)-binding protein [Macroventuria anomochaeta]
MPSKVFLTGGTGYIGGSVLHTIATSHPDWSITVLLRRVPPNFTSSYPNIKIVNGDYDSTDLISSAAKEANIVVHCGDSDHEASLQAIIAGLLRRTTPGHLIHLSGTGIVSDWASPSHLGTLNPKVWSDLDPKDLEEVRSLPDNALHRNTEKILHDAVRRYSDKLHIAIICPPDIYGRGKGLVKMQSALIPLFVKESRALGKVFYYNDGANARSWVHIDDLMRFYLHVVEAAAADDPQITEQYFGENGYHFASTQEHSHIEVAAAVGKILTERGIIEDAEPVRVELETLDGMANIPGFPKLARYLYACNSRTEARRAEKLWGYRGEAVGLIEGLEGDVRDALGGGER